MAHHRHQSIPNCDSSHPNNPIPTEPKNPHTPFSSITEDMAAQSRRPSSPRSSGESLSLTDDTTDSETPPSTPPNGTQDDVDEITEKMGVLAQTQTQTSPTTRKRRASTTYASSSEEIKRLLGDGSGTKFLQKYCCGEGCCMLEKLPTHPEDTGISMPDNAAFQFLNLNLKGLTLDTELTKVVDMPEQKIKFGSLRRKSISEKFPNEDEHEHDAAHVQDYPPEYMKPHPPYSIFNAPVYGARELTKPGAEKRTFHFDLDVTDYPEEGGVDFKVGGAVGVCPPNDPAMVEDVLDQLGVPHFQRDKPVRLHTTGGRWPTIWGEEEARELVTTRREVLTWTVDIQSTPPIKPLFRLFAEHATDTNEKKILTYLCSAQGQAAFCDLRTGPHLTLQQLLLAFPSSRPPLEALCGVLTQLMPRFYSLSNDPHVSSAREGLAGRRLIEMAVTVHETAAHAGSTRTGVGSGFLERVAKKFICAEQDAQDAAARLGSTVAPGVAGRKLHLQIPMFRGLMANPLSKEFASDGPMVLIGAGVGMAPFRGFILNRLKNANCANKIWLIQGIRDSMLDEIYRGELGAHEKDIKKVVQSRASAPPPVAEGDAPEDADTDSTGLTGTAKLDAESRSQRKVAKYVQDEVRLQADIVWFVINAVDGRIFVCGSTKGMGEGVERALVDVAMDKGGLDYETARQFWRDKEGGGQFIAETW
ncbi:uncharacterized protein LTR77_005192 [Saxophila tyrrhenica]|uniref:FAD-binding FR-type domain-containing protein n=1 Tax=Saxophila tyrrhenica TaxID=1690608 RepID=A0AAV9PFJ0_9PEZI|nr:hypothetical protein LTR77_005192 [Saxophila tyrrhenica]